MKKYLCVILLSLQIILPLQAYAVSEKDFKIFFLGQSIGYMSSLLSDISSSFGIVDEETLKIKSKRFNKSIGDQGSLIKTEVIKLSDNIYEIYRELVKESRNKLSNPTIVKLNSLLALYYEEIGQWYYQQLPQNKWVFDLGFYTSYQLAAINLHSPNIGETKLLSGAERFLQTNPYHQDTTLTESISRVGELDKKNLSTKLDKNELSELTKQLNLITGQFSNITTILEQDKKSSATKSDKETVPPIEEISKTFSGTWQGTLTSPSGVLHNLHLTVHQIHNSAMSLDGVFSKMILKDITTVGNKINFRIRPSDTSDFFLDFQGLLNANTIKGSVIDSEGQVGTWQVSQIKVLNTPTAQIDLIPQPPSQTTPQPSNLKQATVTQKEPKAAIGQHKSLTLDALLGQWQGKIIEHNGAISSLTLFIDLIRESKLVIQQDKKKTESSLKEFGIKDGYITFVIQSKQGKAVKFSGKLSDDMMEGHADSSDKQTAIWKLKKIIP